jgi:D-alanine-D-alanine ligase
LIAEGVSKNIGKVAILTGGYSPERDIALVTAKCVEEALKELNIDYKVFLAEENFHQEIKSENIDIVFIAMHGGLGENGGIQGMLETLGVPYTGSGVLASAVCMNKIYSKKIFEFHGIKTPKWQTLESIDELKLALPLVVKPAMGGSTIATSIVTDESNLQNAFEITLDECKKTNDEVMAEEYIPGRELTVGILDGKALPLLEIKSKTEFYDYKAKYEPGMSEHSHPDDIETELYEKIQKTAEYAFKVTGCEGMGRVDFRLNNEDIFVLEINTIPGMTQTSLLPEAAEIAGIDFNTLIIKILESAKKKNKTA